MNTKKIENRIAILVYLPQDISSIIKNAKNEYVGENYERILYKHIKK